MALTETQSLMSTVRLSNGLKSRLVKIGARLSLKDGRARSMEEIIELLADVYDKHSD
jgi:hypothetical protein